MCKRGFKSTGHGNIPRLEPAIWIIAPPAARRVYIPNSKLAHQPKSQRAWEWGWADTRYLYARCESNFPPLWWCGQLPHPGYVAVCEISTSPGKGEGAGGDVRISNWSVHSSDEHFTRIDGWTSQRVVAGWKFSVIVWYIDERLSAKSFIWRGTAHMSRCISECLCLFHIVVEGWALLLAQYSAFPLKPSCVAIWSHQSKTVCLCLPKNLSTYRRTRWFSKTTLNTKRSSTNTWNPCELRESSGSCALGLLTTRTVPGSFTSHVTTKARQWRWSGLETTCLAATPTRAGMEMLVSPVKRSIY